MAPDSSSSKATMEEKEEEGGVMETLVAVGAAVGVAAVAWWGLSKLFGGSGEKMMKATGKEYYMPRKDFESSPADWFRNHRN